MDGGYRLVIITSLLLIYCVQVIFWGDGSPRHQVAIEPRHSSVRIDTRASSYGHINRSLVPGSAQNLTPSNDSNSTAPKRPPCVWKVLFWSYMYQSPLRKYLEGQRYCPETDCTVKFTHSSSYDVMRTSNVIILHHIGNWDMAKINRVRRADQIIAYLSRESPLLSARKEHLKHFNWTMTYNSRSEVPIPYGWLVETKGVDASRGRTKNWARGKTGLAIWIVSNCNAPGWPRTSYGKALAKFMKIDIFGGCGKPCGEKDACYRKIFSYKFYIAFENSECDDYITEKFWRNALQYDAVPIVYGAPKRDYQRLAPKNSFIHISDFRNVSSLAAYIDTLDKNDTLYNRYFEWRLSGHRAEALSMGEATVSKGPICAISKRLDESSDQHSNSSDRDWFAKSCEDVPRPEMV